MDRDLIICLVGEAGEGIISLGEILTRVFARLSWEVLAYRTYPAEIRGGPTSYWIRIGRRPILSPGDGIDLLFALNPSCLRREVEGLREGGVFLYDRADDRFSKGVVEGLKGIRHYPLPLTDISVKELNYPLGKNMLALGILTACFRFPYRLITELVTNRYPSPDKNLKALEVGHRYGEEHLSGDFPQTLRAREEGPGRRLLISGNQAMALAALAAGCQFFAGYPITPANEILQWLMTNLPRFGGTALQLEDEMSSLAAALGASYAGKRSMTATSGPGLSLMSELIGLSSMGELPVVIVDVQRGGPSTGIPTGTEQADLALACHGSHGEAPRIVLAPSTVAECFYYTWEAFNLAERYQLPVIVLSDQFLGQRLETIGQPDLSKLRVSERHRFDPSSPGVFLRYRSTSSGVSAIPSPGQSGGMYVLTGLEHDAAGVPNYEPDNHQDMMAKRYRKLDRLMMEMETVRRFGQREAELGIIGWGSSQGAVLEAMEKAKGEGYRVAVLYPKLLYPLPNEQIEEFCRPLRRLLVIEANYTGQLARLIRSYTRVTPCQLNLPSGIPIRPSEIYRRIVEELS